MMFECWEHWKEGKSWPDMMMSVIACDAIMWLSLSQIRIWFLMALARVLSKPDSHEKNLTNSIHIYLLI